MRLFLFFSLSSVSAHFLLLGDADWRLGALAGDLALALLLTCLGQLSLRWHRLSLALLLAVYSVLLVANMESIAALGKSIDLRDLAYLFDAGFLAASLSYFQFPVFTAMLLIAAAWVAWSERQWLPRTSALGRSAVVIASAAGLGVLLLNPASHWQNNQIMLPGLVRALASNPGNSVAGGRAPGLDRDLQGNSLLQAPPAQNIVLLVLEGITGDYLADNSSPMPELNKLAQQGSSASQIYSHSHQTIRGLYALLCGDYSKLSLDVTKAAEYLQLPVAQRPLCLPGALASQGYYTSYLQAAPLAYMGKDRFMPAIGFREVRGEESLPRRYADVGWGPDDRAFLEQAAEHIVQLHQQPQPFFSTLLTVGTHHPYTLPAAERSENPKLAAVRYLDAALPGFWQTLAAAGVWEDTLLLITSDESHAGPRALWVARGPGVPIARIENIYGLLDVPISVLDYLNLAEEYPSFGGRSLFRDYPTTRALLYSSDRLYAYTAAGELLHCESQQRCFNSKRGNTALSKAVAGEQFKEMQRWRRQADASLRFASDATAMTLLDKQRLAVSSGQLNILAAGKYLDLPAGREIQLDLRASYQGSGSVELRPQVVATSNDARLIPQLDTPALRNGRELSLRYRFALAEPASAAHPNLFAVVHQGSGQLQVETFSISVGDPVSEVFKPVVERSSGWSPTSIGHAGGRWQGRDYTNSIEAIEANASRFPLLELDLSLSADQQVVCLHGWDLGYRAVFGERTEAPLSFAGFEQKVSELRAGFHPCTETSLPGLLQRQPNLRLVIDSWAEPEPVLQRLLAVVPDATQRVIPQAYTPDQIGRFRELGFRDVIWTLYRFAEREQIERVVELAVANQPWAVSMPSELAASDLPERLLEAGLAVYVHTVNDCEEAIAYWQRGLSLYSDTLQSGDCQPPE